jgi:hypothetical protein
MILSEVPEHAENGCHALALLFASIFRLATRTIEHGHGA